MLLVADSRAMSFSVDWMSFSVDLFSFSVDLKSFVASTFASERLFGLEMAAAASMEAAARAICSPVDRLFPALEWSLS